MRYPATSDRAMRHWKFEGLGVASYGMGIAIGDMAMMTLTTQQIRTELQTLAAKLVAYPTWISVLARRAELIAEMQKRGQTSW